MEKGKYYLDTNFISEVTGKSYYRLAKEYGLKDNTIFKYKRIGLPRNCINLFRILIDAGLLDARVMSATKPAKKVR